MFVLLLHMVTKHVFSAENRSAGSDKVVFVSSGCWDASSSFLEVTSSESHVLGISPTRDQHSVIVTLSVLMSVRSCFLKILHSILDNS